MSEELLVRHCSPTLAGMKTANLFTCFFENAKELRESVRRLNKMLVKKGLRVLPLRFWDQRALIYVYRPSRLSRDLQRDTASRLLKECGYEDGAPEHCIVQLVKRLESNGEFPHEIGLFLGYPPEDVWGFIKNRAEGCKCAGCWKVYGDVAAAKELFAKYKKCTDVYCAMFARGQSIERLTVAV